MEKGIFDIEFVRAAIEKIIGNEDYSLASFYEQITEPDEIERYVQKYQDILEDANKNDKKASGVVVMDGNGAITNLNSTYICPFEFTVQLGAKLANRDEALEKVREVQNRLKGRKLDIALLDTGALVVVETADGITPKDDDYLGSVSSVSNLNDEVPELIKNIYGEISIISGTYETVALTISAGVSTSGDFKIYLDNEEYIVSLNSSVHNTAEKVANKIYGDLLSQGVFSNWTIDLVGAVITLTAKTYGAKSDTVIVNTTVISTAKVVKWTITDIPTKAKTIHAILANELAGEPNYSIAIDFDPSTDTTTSLTAEHIRNALSSAEQNGWEISGTGSEVILTYLGVEEVPATPYFNEDELIEKSKVSTAIQFTSATQNLSATDWSIAVILNSIPHYLKCASLGQATNEDDFALSFDSIIRNNAWSDIDGIGEQMDITDNYIYVFDELSNRVILTAKANGEQAESSIALYTKSNVYQAIEFDLSLTSLPHFGSKIITFEFESISYSKTIDLTSVMVGSYTIGDIAHYITEQFTADTTIASAYDFSYDDDASHAIIYLTALTYGKKGNINITTQPLFILYERTITSNGSQTTIPPTFEYNIVFRQYGYENEVILALTTTIVEEGSVVVENIVNYEIAVVKGTIEYQEGEYVPEVGETHYIAIANTLLRKIVFGENELWQIVSDGVPTHSAFYKYKLDMSFNAFKCEEPYTMNADDVVTIIFGGSATVVKEGVLLGNDIVKTKIAVSGFENTSEYFVEPLDFPSNIDADGIDFQLRGDRFKKRHSKTSVDGGLTFTFAVDLNNELLRYFYFYGRYGKWSTATISPNSKYMITEITSYWGNVYKNEVLCSLRKVENQNTESDVMNVICIFNYEGDGQ